MSNPSAFHKDPNAFGFDALSRTEQAEVMRRRPPGVPLGDWLAAIDQSTAHGAAGKISAATSSVQTLRYKQKEDQEKKSRADKEGETEIVRPITFAEQIGEKPEDSMSWLERILARGLAAIGLSENARTMAKSATEAVREFIKHPGQGLLKAGRWIGEHGRTILHAVKNYIKDKIDNNSDAIVNHSGETWDWIKAKSSKWLEMGRDYLGINGPGENAPMPAGNDSKRMQDVTPSSDIAVSVTSSPNMVAETAKPAARDGLIPSENYRGNTPANRRDLAIEASMASTEPTTMVAKSLRQQTPRMPVLALFKAQLSSEPRLEMA